MPIKAALDVGSNSVKLLVAELADDGSYKVLHEASEITALSKNLTPGGPLAPDNAARTLEVIGMFADRARQLGAGTLVAAGTSALRDAGDGREFAQRASALHGVRIEILSGAEEARLGRAVALRELPPNSTDVLFFDIGGGSTELTLLHAGAVQAEVSLQLGARRVTDAAAIEQPVKPGQREAADRFIAERLDRAPRPAAGVRPLVAGLGGTASTAVLMLAGKQALPPGDPHNSIVTLPELADLLEAIALLDLPQLKQWPNLNPSRAAVIYAGISIIRALLAHYDVEQFLLLDRGLRYGLLLEQAG